MFAIRNTKKFIIAMKGPPFTRKTELAILIAKSLKCPILSLDDVINSLDPDNFQTPPSSTCLRDLAFGILCDMAYSHLLQGVSDNIVVNSPLASQSHLDKLVVLANKILVAPPQIVIVECKPKNTYSWRLKFQSYVEEHSYYTKEWYKPKSWEDVEMAIKDDCDLKLDDHLVSKLVLDPFKDGPYFSPTATIYSVETPRFMDAVHYMMTREIGDGPNIVAYDKWHQLKYTKEHNDGDDNGQPSRRQGLCRDGHSISNYSYEGLEHEPNCMACESQIIGPAYTCEDCSLALHKECAESFGSQYRQGRPGERFACTLCKEDGKGFSVDCGSCLFETRLKCDVRPTVIWHECEEHFLSTLPSPVRDETYLCAACGDHDFGLANIYTCKACNVFYHYDCLTKVPSRLMHVHGGHHHYMLLKLSIEPEEEDYICDECLDCRDPQLWFYSCEECSYVTHLYCALPRQRKELFSDPRLKDKKYEHTIVFYNKGALSSELKRILEQQNLQGHVKITEEQN